MANAHTIIAELQCLRAGRKSTDQKLKEFSRIVATANALHRELQGDAAREYKEERK